MLQQEQIASKFMVRGPDPGAGVAESNLPASPSSGHQADSLIAEALNEPLFEAQWNDRSDEVFRPFAAAVLQLTGAAPLPEDSRKALYRDLCTRRRVEVLAEVLKEPVAPRVVRLLSRTDWQGFSHEDWVGFFAIARAESSHSALAHARRLTSTLVGQFARIPEELRLPAMLEVAGELDIPAARWDRLRQFIQQSDAGRRAALLRAAGTVDSKVAFWDFYFRCEGKHDCRFEIPCGMAASELLEPLGSPGQMESEALRMSNCLANRVSRVWSGNRFYFRARHGTAVDAELVRLPDQWVPGNVLGPANAPVPAELAGTIQDELRRLAASTPAGGRSREAVRQDAYVEGLCEDAGAAFGADAIERFAEPLRLIRAKSRSWSDGAFTAFVVESGCYVQFMSSPDGNEYLCEISSHKYVDGVDDFLTAEAVDVIESAGFVWPTGNDNFLRWFTVSSDEQLVTMAELALAILERVFRHRAGQAVKIETHIPSFRESFRISRTS